jgi:hypothetical protein
MSVSPTSTSETASVRHKGSNWWRPTISPEHGAYVVLFVSFLTGAAAAQQWTNLTTLAFVCAFLGFQSEHPLALQIRQRKSLKPRFLVWGGLYGGVALTIACYLYWQLGAWISPLLGIYLAAFAAVLFDGIAVLHREQKTILNEWVTFAATCLAAPFAYLVTTGSLAPVAIGLWMLNALFFTSSIFTVKLRKAKSEEMRSIAIQRILLYHAAASAIVVGLSVVHLVSLWTILPFGIVLVKVGFILWQRHWYCTTPIRSVAMVETVSALLFWITVSLSVLPTHLHG